MTPAQIRLDERARIYRDHAAEVRRAERRGEMRGALSALVGAVVLVAWAAGLRKR